jgi:hypothetical protein
VQRRAGGVERIGSREVVECGTKAGREDDVDILVPGNGRAGSDE